MTINNKHLVNVAISHIKEGDNAHGIGDIKRGIYNDINGIHADLNTVKTDILTVNSKSNEIKDYLDSVKGNVDNLPSVIDARVKLVEEVSNAYIDGKISGEEAKRIANTLKAIKEAKDYTDVKEIGTTEYINSIKSEVIDYSDTLLHNLETALGPLAWEDKVELARLGETVIDGGYLKTELIKAHSIGAEKINTDELVVGTNIGIGESIPLLIEERSALAETVSKAYADGVVGSEEVRSIQATLDALNAAKGYTDTSESNAKNYADGKLIESIGYSDTLISQLESNLGPLAWEDKVEIARLGQTVIDGGYLKTELIKANSIGADKINTNELIVGDNITLGPNAIIEWTQLSDESKDNLKGETGPQGEQGTKGDKGDKGDTGEQGLRGLQGVQGNQGIKGIDGVDGTSSYTHIAYSTSSTGSTGFSTSDPMNKTYIGMYVDDIPTDSEVPSKYKWTLIKGSDGSQGIPGVKGVDGQTPYLHIAYATNSTGSAGFSTTVSTGKTYIGQYTDYTSADSGDASKYKWTLIKGEKGDTGSQGLQGVKGDTGAKGATGSQGPQGVVGPQGPQGIKGDTGPQGSQGPRGTTGPQGVTGRGVSQIRTQYYLSTSKTTETGGSWSYTAPTWSPGKYVWTRSVIDYTNPTTQATTTAMVDSSWEASMVSNIGGEAKKFINPTSISSNAGSITGYLIVKTPIMASRMLTFKLSGYNYVTNNSLINVSASFYHYTSGALQHSFQSFGSYKVNEVRAGRDSAGRAVLIIGTPTSTWSYPKVNVDEVIVGYQSSPDDYITGWSMEFSTSISAYSQIQLLNGYDSKDSLDKSVKTVTVEYNLSTSHTTANGSWVTTAPTYVQDRYMWTRTRTILNNGTSTYMPSTAGVLIAGAIPNYITSTKITNAKIESPEFIGNTGRFAETVFVGAAGNTAGITGVGSADSSVRFWAGSSASATAPFRVTQDGKLYATNADITGNLETIATGNRRTVLEEGSLTMKNTSNPLTLSEPVYLGNNKLISNINGTPVPSGLLTLSGRFLEGTVRNATSNLDPFQLTINNDLNHEVKFGMFTDDKVSDEPSAWNSQPVLTMKNSGVQNVRLTGYINNSRTSYIMSKLALGKTNAINQLDVQGSAGFTGSLTAGEGGNVPIMESGTFTPRFVTITGAERANPPSYLFRIGKYQKVGNMVHFYLSMQTRRGDLHETVFHLTGLPFVPLSSNTYDFTSFICGYFSNIFGDPPSINCITGQLYSGRIVLFSSLSDGTVTVCKAKSNRNTIISISGSYFV